MASPIAGWCTSQADTALTTCGDIDNTGTIAARNNASLAATGATSAISSNSESILAAGVQTDGSIGATGSLAATATRQVRAKGKNLSGGELRFTAQSVELTGSSTSAKSMAMIAGDNDLDLHSTTLNATGSLTLRTNRRLRTDAAVITADQFAVSAYSLSNVAGELLQTGSGDLRLSFAGNLDNTRGLIATNSTNFSLAGSTLTNTSGRIQHAGDGEFNIATTTLTG